MVLELLCSSLAFQLMLRIRLHAVCVTSCCAFCVRPAFASSAAVCKLHLGSCGLSGCSLF